MSFPCYEHYKESGVEWLGTIPGHWETRRLRFLVEIKKRIVGELGPDILSITQQGIRVRDAESNDGQVSMDYSKYQIVERGDFAMNHMDLLTGYVDISKFHGVTSPDYRVFSTRPGGGSDERFLLYLFQNAYKRKIFFAFGQGSSQLGRWRLPTEAFTDFLVPLPPLREQSSIVRFLASETAKIDALIEEQRRLIELLKEKRQAVISHAVTKGLNPQTECMDTGIDWIGQTPSHWKIGKCGFYISILSGFAFPSEKFSDNECDVKLLRGINVGVGVIRWDEAVYWPRTTNDELDRYEMRTGDIVLGMDRPIIGSGVRVAMVRDSDLPCLLLQRVARITAQRGLLAEYLLALLSSEMFFAHFSPETTGVSVPHISPEQISNFTILIPPIEEQRKIVTFLAAEKRDTYLNISKDVTRVMNRHKALYRSWGIACAGTQV
jgi:type I restriction enzyme S subunit